jgi:mannose-6-phosphate isomerase
MFDADSPLLFTPIFQERIWGGQKLAELFGKDLPPGKRIGESWEFVDRPEAQSIVRGGPMAGRSLHDLWSNFRKEVFGKVADAPRFPLLIKLLDAQEKLSLQVHPSKQVAESLGGEAKTEFWYFAAADPHAEIFAGLRETMTQEQFARALRSGTIAECVHRIPVKSGDAMFLPSGRFHAIGAGNVLIEIQQNSDTTYRVFDWNRVDDGGKPRSLHIAEALQCINFEDVTPGVVQPDEGLLVRDQVFEVQKWNLDVPREIGPAGEFAIILCLSGRVGCRDLDLAPGELFLVPASLEDRSIYPRGGGTSLLRVTFPK